MPIQPWQSFDPDAGRFFLIFQRRFRYVIEHPEPTFRVKWLAVVLACPICGAEEDLRLAHQTGDIQVQGQCPKDHIWDEPRIDVGHFHAYGRMRWTNPDPDWQWLLDAGFGEEPPPPMEMKDIIDAAKVGGKLLAREWKKQAKATVRKPVRQAKREMKKQAMRPVAAVLRTAWAWQAGGVQPVEQPKRRKERSAPEPKTPPLSAYRKAYGMEAPKKGPKCLVCEDSGRISAQGVSIPCTECKGPAAAAMATAERRAAKAREPKAPKAGTPAVQKVTGSGNTRVVQVSGNGQQVNGQTARAITRPPTAQEAAAARGAVNEAARLVRESRGQSSSTVQIHGKNNSVVNNTVTPSGG